MTGAPYLVVRSVERTGPDSGRAEWTPTGRELGAAQARPTSVPLFLLVEAMAQTAGMTLGPSEGRRWLLAEVSDAAMTTAPAWDALLTAEATIQSRRGRFVTVDVTVVEDGVERARARLRMAAFTLSEDGVDRP